MLKKLKSTFKKGELKTLWPFYLECLISPILLIYVAFYIIYFKNIGFSLFQIGLLFSSLALSSLLFEIPTGAIADIFGRKFSTLLGNFLSAICLCLVYFFNSFWIVLLLLFLFGASSTLISGASDAWVVDLLKSKKMDRLIKDYYIKRYSFSAISFILAGILGAILVKSLGMKTIWIASGISLFFSFFILSFGEENFTKRKINVKNNFLNVFNHTKKSIKYSFKNKILLNLLLLAFFASLLVSFVSVLTWQPFLKELGLKDYWFGYFFSLSYLPSVIIPYFISPLVKFFKGYANYLFVILCFMAFSLITVYFLNNLILGIIICIFFLSMWDFFNPAEKILFQYNTPSKMRATITSLESIFFSAGFVFIPPLAGIIADKIGAQNTIALGSIFLIPCLFLLWEIREKSK